MFFFLHFGPDTSGPAVCWWPLLEVISRRREKLVGAKARHKFEFCHAQPGLIENRVWLLERVLSHYFVLLLCSVRPLLFRNSLPPPDWHIGEWAITTVYLSQAERAHAILIVDRSSCLYESWQLTSRSYRWLCSGPVVWIQPALALNKYCVRSALNLNEVRDFHLRIAFCFAIHYSRYACLCLFFRCGVDLHRDVQLNYTVVLVSPFCGSMDSSWFKLTIVDILFHWVFPLYTIRTRRSAWIIVMYYSLLSLEYFRWLGFNQPWRLTYGFAIG